MITRRQNPGRLALGVVTVLVLWLGSASVGRAATIITTEPSIYEGAACGACVIGQTCQPPNLSDLFLQGFRLTFFHSFTPVTFSATLWEFDPATEHLAGSRPSASRREGG